MPRIRDLAISAINVDQPRKGNADITKYFMSVRPPKSPPPKPGPKPPPKPKKYADGLSPEAVAAMKQQLQQQIKRHV